MSGEELKKKLESAGISQAEIARRLGVVPTSVWQFLSAKDVKTGLLEDLCRVFEIDMSFFYDGASYTPPDYGELKSELDRLRQENAQLKAELSRHADPDHPKKESEIYRLWMEHMRITERMQELYEKEKKG